jgi:hypothetical protein
MTFSLKSTTFAQHEQTTANKPLIAVLLRCVSLLLIVGYLGLGVSEAVAVTCPANTNPVSDCDDLSISGNNLTITVPNVPNVVTVGGASEAIVVLSTNVTLNNAGVINGFYGVHIYNGGLTTLNNTDTGIISSSYIGILNSYSPITTLNNAGTISAVNTGIFNVGPLTTINNTGTISSTIGIFNGDTITTLNNKQGASGSPLTYQGALPTNYNIIIASPTNHGKLSASSVGSSTVTFNIYGNTGTTLVSGIAASTVAAGTYSSVLTGVSASNIISSLSGTYTGGYTWLLVNTSGTIWDLVVTGSSTGGSTSSNGATISNITAGTLVGLSSIGVTANPVLAGGTLVLNRGDSSSVSIAITSAGGTIQQPTSGSATLSGVFSGAGGLTFIGTGSTIMSGANT